MKSTKPRRACHLQRLEITREKDIDVKSRLSWKPVITCPKLALSRPAT